MPRFELRHGDADILAMLEHGVPPVDLGKISIFSSHIAKYRVEAPEVSEVSQVPPPQHSSFQ